MFKLTIDGFEAQKKDGVYIFSSPECKTCSDHITNFNKYMNDYFVLHTSEDPEYFEQLGIRLTPETRVYKKNELVWSKNGMLFDSQFDELRKFL